MNKEINFNVNIVKFIAICLITLFHIDYYFDLNMKIINYGWIGCAIFFVISGYLNTNFNLKILKKRILRLLPLYYLSLFFWLVTANKNFEISDILSHIFFTFNFNMSSFYSINGVAWFTAVLIQIYLVYFLIFRRIINKKYYPAFMIIALHILTLFLSKFASVQPVITKSILVYLPCFIAGFLIKEKRYNEIIITIMSSVFLLTLNCLTFETKNTFLIEYMLCISFAWTIISIKFNFRQNSKKIINLIAKSSYAIYLFNYAFIFLPDIKNNILNLIISFIFVISIGILINKTVEEKLQTYLKHTFSCKENCSRNCSN